MSSRSDRSWRWTEIRRDRDLASEVPELVPSLDDDWTTFSIQVPPSNKCDRIDL